MSVIANTTVLSNFAAIGKIDLLRQLFTHLYLPTEVYDEIRNGLDEGYQFYASIPNLIYPPNPHGWLRLTSFANNAELQELTTLPVSLHAGESACLAIARHRGWLLLTDDTAARKAAEQRGIAFSGTIGSLVIAVERQVCAMDTADEYLAKMIAAGYRSPYHSLSSLLAS